MYRYAVRVQLRNVLLVVVFLWHQKTNTAAAVCETKPELPMSDGREVLSPACTVAAPSFARQRSPSGRSASRGGSCGPSSRLRAPWPATTEKRGTALASAFSSCPPCGVARHQPHQRRQQRHQRHVSHINNISDVDEIDDTSATSATNKDVSSSKEHSNRVTRLTPS